MLAALVTGCAPASDSGDPGATAQGEPAVVRQPLPQFGPGTRLSDVTARLADWSPGHRFSGGDAPAEGWEWSGPDGMRVEAWFMGGVAVSMRVSRTYGSGAPAADGHRLPDDFIGRPMRTLEAAVGPGLLVERAWGRDLSGGVSPLTETYKWKIFDHGLDTGLFLTITVHDGVVAGVDHRWSHA